MPWKRPRQVQSPRVAESRNPLSFVVVMIALFTGSIAVAPGCGSAPELDAPTDVPDDAEARSLLGRVLRAPALPEDVEREYKAKLDAARVAFEQNPNDLDAIIWYGRRTAYLGQYRNAVAIYTGGLRTYPDAPHLYRHRGHRYVTLRRFNDAIFDLERAGRLIQGRPDEIEPDGLPNARNQPTSTLHSNIWYHLGLAYYVTNRLEKAHEAYRKCLAVSRNPDMLSATSHWAYLTLRRLGRDDKAAGVLRPITADMDIIENHGYHRLLLMYKGEIPASEIEAEYREKGASPSTASIGYGLASWYRLEGREDRGIEILEDLVENAPWAAFGVIAAEADLARERR